MEIKEQTTETQQEAPKFESGSAAEFEALMQGRITPQVAVEPKQEATNGESAAQENTDKPAENLPIELGEAAEAATTEKPAAEKGVDDFDAKFSAKFKELFGDEPDAIKTKLSTPAKPTYKSPLAELADEYLPKGMSQSDFFTFVATDFTKMAPIDLLDLKLSIESPELTPEDRELILIDKYRLSEDATPAEVALGKYAMNQDSKAALSEYQAKKEKLISDKTEPAAQQEAKPDPAHVAKQQYWGKESSAAAKLATTFTIPLSIKDIVDATKSDELPVTFNIPAKEAAKLEQWAKEYGPYTTASTPAEMAKILTGMYVSENYPKIVQLATERAVSMNNEKWARLKGNYQEPKGKNASPVQAVGKGTAREFMQLMDGR